MAKNAELEAKIVKKMFAEAEAAGWITLTDNQRSQLYARWMTDPEVGGRLTEFMSSDRARVWIKDGPMKEYARARYGVGKYAEHVENPAAGVDLLVKRTLGSEWEVVPDSHKIKPLRVLIRNGEDERHFTWAPSAQLKHLVWAAIKAEAAGGDIPWVLCVVGSFERPTPADEKESNERVGARCQLEIVHVDEL